MKKGAKALLIILALAAVAAIGFFIYRKLHPKEEDGGTAPSGSGTATGGSSSTGSTSTSTGFPLQYGSRGDKVKFLQHYVNWYEEKSLLTEDGIWGPKTEIQIRKVLPTTCADGKVTKDEYEFREGVYNAALSQKISPKDLINYLYNTSTKRLEKKATQNGSGSSNYTPGTSYLGNGII